MNTNIKEKSIELYPVRMKLNKKCTGEYDQNLPRRKAFMRGYTMAMEDFFKINKEVKRQIYGDEKA